MNYYDKYFRYYEKIMKPVIEWRKELDHKDKKKLRWYLWGGGLLVVAEVIAIILGSKFLGVINAIYYGGVTIVGVIIMITTINYWEKCIGKNVNKYKQKVAKKYQASNFEELVRVKEKELIDKLMEERITTKEQYRILIDAIDQQLKAYKPKRILNYGALGGLLLPVWNNFTQKLFEEEILVASGVSIIIIGVLIYIFIIVNKVMETGQEIYNLTNNNIYKLQGLKEILMELELKEWANQ